MRPQATGSSRLAFKVYEIEELADIYFYRPVGWTVAVSARFLGLTPNGVSLLAGVVGTIGGLLLYQPWGLTAFALLVLHGIFDSADGQLARMTGRVTPLGRIIDGVAGYAMYTAAFLALAAGLVSRGASASVFVWAVAAGVSTAMQAQMYDYHRTSYVDIVLRGRAEAASSGAQGPGLLRFYESVQRVLGGLHPAVERAIGDRARAGRPLEADQARYRSIFYRLVRGWNLLGDNTRVYAVGVLAWFHRLDLFFLFLVVPMNLVLVALWLWQARADRRFLGSL